MKIGVVAAFNANTPPELIAAAGGLAEERGFHAFWVPEHVLFFREIAEHYPSFGGKRGAGIDQGLLDPFIALTYLAAQTERIRLGTGICVVPQRNPVYTAKQVADLDFLSGGRFDFGIGVGWLRREFRALGEPWERRGARTNEAIQLMQTLWCDEVSKFEGEFYQLPECVMNPKPVQSPHPPLYFGGDSEGAFRRAARFGHGWFGFNLTPSGLAERLERLNKGVARTGRREPNPALEIVASPENRGTDQDGAKAFRDLGVDQLMLGFSARDSDGLERAADQIAEIKECL